MANYLIANNRDRSRASAHGILAAAGFQTGARLEGIRWSIVRRKVEPAEPPDLDLARYTSSLWGLEVYLTKYSAQIALKIHIFTRMVQKCFLV